MSVKFNFRKKYIFQNNSFASNFFIGMGSVFNIAGDYHDVHLKTDQEAIRSDWEAVGNDLRKAMSSFNQKE